MAVVSIEDIIQLNREFSLQNQNIKLHLRDACEAQSMWVEVIDDTVNPSQLLSRAEKHIIDYFALKKISVATNEDKTQYWLIK